MPADAQRFLRKLLDTGHQEVAAKNGGYLGTAVAVGTNVVAVRSNAADITDPSEPADGLFPLIPLAGGPAVVGEPILVVLIGGKEYGVRLKDATAGLALGSSGGDLGSASTAARSNHTHDSTYVKLADADLAFFTDADQDNTAVNATNSTGTFSDFFVDSIVLPSGTWTGAIKAWLMFSNSSATGGANARFRIPSASAQNFGIAGVAGGRFNVPIRIIVSNVSGTVNFAAEYNMRTAGTASAYGWMWDATFVRVA